MPFSYLQNNEIIFSEQIGNQKTLPEIYNDTFIGRIVINKSYFPESTVIV
jgi:hypothetical protein